MTPERMKTIRRRLGLSARAMAEALRLGTGGGRTIRRYESGERVPSGPVTLLYEAFDDGRLEAESHEPHPAIGAHKRRKSN